MSVNVTVNGTTYAIPLTSETGWGASVTSWIQAISQATLQRSGGAFPLTAELDFGSTFGIKTAYLKSESVNISAAGILRLSNTDPVSWRNAGNTSDLALKPNVSTDGVLTYNGVDLVNVSASQTLTNKALDAASNTITGLTNASVSASAAIVYSKLSLTGSIVNADIGVAAAIAYSKLNLASSIVNTDIATGAAIAYAKLNLTGNITNSDIATAAAITYAKLSLANSIVNADINSAAAIAYSKLNLASSIVNTDISPSAGVAYSKLNLAASILNSDIGASAAIAYSKLNLTGSILNADISASAAIARSKLAAGSANQVLINDGTGALSSEAQLAISRGGTGASTKAAAYDALSPNTTKGDLEVFNGTTNVRFPAGTTGYVLTADSAQSAGLKWAASSGGSGSAGKNYVSNYNFENGATTGWSLAHSALTSLIPSSVATAGTAFSASNGGTASNANLSLTATTTNPLSGSYSLQLAASSATVAGDLFISDAFTIDREDRARVLSFKANYEVVSGAANGNFSGTSANSFAIYLYDVANGVWVQPTGVYGLTQNSGPGVVSGIFQSASNATSYQLAIIAVNASTGAITINFDDFSVGPQSVVYGPAMGDWQDWTPTYTALGTVTTTYAKWKRVGDSMLLQMKFTTGTATASTASFTLPNGLTANMAALGIVGYAFNATTSTGPFLSLLATNASNTLQFGASTAWLTAATGSTVNSTQTYAIDSVLIPITGWSANTQMSADSDQRIVSFVGTKTATQAVTANVTDITFVTSKDSHSVWTGSAYPVPQAGDYVIAFNLADNATTNQVIGIYINGVKYRDVVNVDSNYRAATTLLPSLKAGDSLSLRSNTTTTLYGAAGTLAPQLSIFRNSGSAVVQATETVAASGTLSAANHVTSGSWLDVTTWAASDDSHGQLVSGVYTASVPGRFQFSGTLGFSTNATGIRSVRAVATGLSAGTYAASDERDGRAAGVTYCGFDYQIRMNAGDTVKIQGFQSSGGSLAYSTNSRINIKRIGNA